MCGLIAALDADLADRNDISIAEGLEALKHRGLLGRSNWFHLHGTVLGHTRLPIQGLSHEHDQPFVREFTEGPKAGFVEAGLFVGEIFNYKQIDPTATSDVSVFFDGVHKDGAYFDWDGFWAGVYVPPDGQATAFVDYLAQKPLYLHKPTMTVASELRALRAAGCAMTLDKHYLSDVRKWGYCPRPEQTPFNNVYRIPPGCSVDRFGNFRQYYDIAKVRTKLRVRDAVEQALRNRLVSDVPIAVLCSGGLDSTIVALLAARYSDAPVTVFHIDNDEAEYLDAIRWPDNVVLRKLDIPGSQELSEQAMLATEEPVDLGSVVPQYALGRAIRDAGFSVCLTGDGADELFGGYGRAARYDSQHSDIFSELVNYHLPRLDKTMMASTVELRTPYLAPAVVAAALALPYHERTSKQALKAAFADLVPEKILNREKKPLRTASVELGGEAYRNKLVDNFIQRWEV